MATWSEMYFQLLEKPNIDLEIILSNVINGKYVEALKIVNEAIYLNLELPKIKMLVTLLKVLSADPDTTHYEILGVEETANIDDICRAYLKLTVDLHPDTNIFPKAPEAFRRISVAMRVLSHDRSKYDNDLAVAREGARSVSYLAAKLKAPTHCFDGMVSSMDTKLMADFNKDEANKDLEIIVSNVKNGKYVEALKIVNEARYLNLELPETKKLVTLLQVLSADPDITHYELLRVEETANENEIGSAFLKLAVDLHSDTNIFPKVSEAFRRIFEAMGVLSHDRSKYDNDLAVAREARSRVAAKLKAPTQTFDGMVSSMDTEPLLEANKDGAVRAKDMAITKAYQGEYHDALRIAREAQQMDPELPDIKKLVALMKILSAPSHTTYYKLLGVKETDDATTILSAYRRLSIDVQPDQNTFPKASEAFKRIASAASVLCDIESRAKYDQALAAACESAHEAYAAAHDVAARQDDSNSIYRDPVTGLSYFTESFSDDSSSADTSCTDDSSTNASSTDDDSSSTEDSSTNAFSNDASSTEDSSTNASSTDDVGPGSKRASDAQASSTLHTPKKRREGHGPLNFN